MKVNFHSLFPREAGSPGSCAGSVFRCWERLTGEVQISTWVLAMPVGRTEQKESVPKELSGILWAVRHPKPGPVARV